MKGFFQINNMFKAGSLSLKDDEKTPQAVNKTHKSSVTPQSFNLQPTANLQSTTLSKGQTLYNVNTNYGEMIILGANRENNSFIKDVSEKSILVTHSIVKERPIYTVNQTDNPTYSDKTKLMQILAATDRQGKPLPKLNETVSPNSRYQPKIDDLCYKKITINELTTDGANSGAVNVPSAVTTAAAAGPTSAIIDGAAPANNNKIEIGADNKPVTASGVPNAATNVPTPSAGPSPISGHCHGHGTIKKGAVELAVKPEEKKKELLERMMAAVRRQQKNRGTNAKLTFKNAEHENFVSRFRIELISQTPIPIKLVLYENAIPIVEKTHLTYCSILGSNHPISIETKKHINLMTKTRNILRSL